LGEKSHYKPSKDRQVTDDARANPQDYHTDFPSYKKQKKKTKKKEHEPVQSVLLLIVFFDSGQKIRKNIRRRS
jgi:hypothetical protein